MMHTKGEFSMNNLTILAQRLQQAMRERNFTQKKLADLVGVKPATISAYLKHTTGRDGKGVNPSLAIVIDIAKKLEVSLDWLCGISEKNITKKPDDAPLWLNDYLEDLVHVIRQGKLYVVEIHSNIENERGDTEIISNLYIQADDSVLDGFLKEYKKLYDLGHSGTLDESFVETYTQALIDKHKSYLFEWYFGTNWRQVNRQDYENI